MLPQDIEKATISIVAGAKKGIRIDTKLIHLVLDRLGVRQVKRRGQQLYAKCPNPLCRGKKIAWSINENTGQHYCFKCRNKGNLYTLVKDLTGKSLREFLG